MARRLAVDEVRFRTSQWPLMPGPRRSSQPRRGHARLSACNASIVFAAPAPTAHRAPMEIVPSPRRAAARTVQKAGQGRDCRSEIFRAAESRLLRRKLRHCARLPSTSAKADVSAIGSSAGIAVRRRRRSRGVPASVARRHRFREAVLSRIKRLGCFRAEHQCLHRIAVSAVELQGAAAAACATVAEV